MSGRFDVLVAGAGHNAATVLLHDLPGRTIDEVIAEKHPAT